MKPSRYTFLIVPDNDGDSNDYIDLNGNYNETEFVVESQIISR